MPGVDLLSRWLDEGEEVNKSTSQRLALILGPAVLPSWFLSALCPALSRGLEVFWIDAGNRFPAYGLGRTARDFGLDARSALARVRLARPFNIFQLETMVGRNLPKVWKGEPVIVSDPLAPFADEDLSDEEVAGVFSGVLAGMERLPAPWIVLAVERKLPGSRAGIFRTLASRAVRTARLATDEATWRLVPVSGGHGRILEF